MKKPRPLPPHLRRVHAWVRGQPWLVRFTLMNRCLLAVAFLPSGLQKAMGNRFTILPIDDPVGFFFEAMYRTGFVGNIAAAEALGIRGVLIGAQIEGPARAVAELDRILGRRG